MKKSYKVIAPTGINAKCASLLVSIFNKFTGITIDIFYEGNVGDGKSILSFITLLIKYNAILDIEINDKKAEQIFKELDDYLDKLNQRILLKI